MARWRRRAAIGLGALAVVLLLGYALVWRPVADAAAFLRVLDQPAPSRPALERLGAVWGRTPAAPAGESVAYLALPGPAPAAPVIVAVAGVTSEGFDDPRVWRLASAFRAAGFAVLLPEVPGLVRPGTPGDPADAVALALSAAASGAVPGADRARVSVVGVSLGGGAALRAVVRRSDTDPAKALLLVGAADDARRLAAGWFEVPVAPPDGRGRYDARSDAGLFARHGLLRAALGSRVTGEDGPRLREWLDRMGDEPASAAPPPEASSPEGRRWVAAAVAEDRASEADRAWILEAAADTLAQCSPAAWDGDLARLRTPAFLIHGASDPLVPADEMGRLAERLRRRVPVKTLSSRVLAHVDVGTPGLAQTWRHLRFLSAFFRAARGEAP